MQLGSWLLGKVKCIVMVLKENPCSLLEINLEDNRRRPQAEQAEGGLACRNLGTWEARAIKSIRARVDQGTANRVQGYKSAS